jgi:hypothetical protein
VPGSRVAVGAQTGKTERERGTEEEITGFADFADRRI